MKKQRLKAKADAYIEASSKLEAAKVAAAARTEEKEKMSGRRGVDADRARVAEAHAKVAVLEAERVLAVTKHAYRDELLVREAEQGDPDASLLSRYLSELQADAAEAKRLDHDLAMVRQRMHDLAGSALSARARVDQRRRANEQPTVRYVHERIAPALLDLAAGRHGRGQSVEAWLGAALGATGTRGSVSVEDLISGAYRDQVELEMLGDKLRRAQRERNEVEMQAHENHRQREEQAAREQASQLAREQQRQSDARLEAEKQSERERARRELEAQQRGAARHALELLEGRL